MPGSRQRIEVAVEDLADVSLNSASAVFYLYNAFEQRVQKDVGGAITQFVFDQVGHLIVEADGSGATIREYVWLDDAPIALVDHAGSSPMTYYIHADHLGRPQKMTDAPGNVVWDGVFDPFGKVTSLSGAATNLLMFLGQFHDSETQLSQNWHRDCDPSLGRYIESDPIGLEGGINTYA